MVWFVQTKDLSDETIAGLLEYGTAEVISYDDCILKVYTYTKIKNALLSCKNVIAVTNFNPMKSISAVHQCLKNYHEQGQ